MHPAVRARSPNSTQVRLKGKIKKLKCQDPHDPAGLENNYTHISVQLAFVFFLNNHTFFDICVAGNQWDSSDNYCQISWHHWSSSLSSFVYITGKFKFVVCYYYYTLTSATSRLDTIDIYTYIIDYMDVNTFSTVNQGSCFSGGV